MRKNKNPGNVVLAAYFNAKFRRFNALGVGLDGRCALSAQYTTNENRLL